jgi:hypothetical protein
MNVMLNDIYLQSLISERDKVYNRQVSVGTIDGYAGIEPTDFGCRVLENRIMFVEESESHPGAHSCNGEDSAMNRDSIRRSQAG